ncbi:MAG: hypothetical protein WDM76_17100 [Limisphaerales bacterium]
MQDEVNGLLFDAFKSGDLVKKMSRFISDILLCKKLIEATGYERSFADEAREVVQIYQRALSVQI